METQILQDPDLTDEMKNSMLVLYALGEGNPGAYTVVSKIYNLIEEDETKNVVVMEFIRNLLIKNITGARLWYIYKNEANYDANRLTQLDLNQFTNDYFYNKFEKFI